MSTLNESQAYAAHHIEGPMMVLAGPGTGKTQLLSARIEVILKESGLSGKNILCLTYTDAGAHAMRQRLLGRIGPEAYAVNIETFHAFCVRVIQEYPEAFGAMQSARQIEKLESYQKIHKLLEKLPVASPLRNAKMIQPFIRPTLEAISILKRENYSPQRFYAFLQDYTRIPEAITPEVEEVLTRHARKALTDDEILCLNDFLSQYAYFENDLQAPEELSNKERTTYRNHWKKILTAIREKSALWSDFALVYENYTQDCQEQGLYDYDDMILWVIAQFEKNPSFLALFQETYQYILVDEYQDTNGAQAKLMYLLAGGQEGAPNLFVVGDDKQSIYRFQGASVENMEAFAQRFQQDLRLVTLNQNYRSTQAILDAADALIQCNPLLLENWNLSRELEANVTYENQKPRFVELSHERAQMEACVQEIEEAYAKGIPYSEIAILYRTHQEVEGLVAMLKDKKIPFQRKIQSNILSLPWVKAWFSYLKLIVQPEKSTLTFQVLAQECFGVKAVDLLKFSLYAASKRGQSWMKILSSKEALQDADISPESPLFTFFESIAERHQALANQSPAEWFLETARQSGLFSFALGEPSRHKLFVELQRLYQDLREFLKKDPERGIADYLQHMELHEFYGLPLEVPELSLNKEAVQLMTAHSSKGLEFEKVIIWNVTAKWNEKKRNNVPHSLPRALVSQRQDEEVELEESRRLFYVAMTRAKKDLVLLAPLFENGKPVKPCLFVSEMEDFLSKEKREGEGEVESQIESFLKGSTQEPDQAWRDFMTAHLQHYRLSATHLNHFHECRLMFYYQSLMKIPREVNVHQQFGTAMHRALELFHKAHHFYKKLPTQASLLQFYAEALEKIDATAEEKERYLHQGEGFLRTFYEEEAQHCQPTILSELSFKNQEVLFEGLRLDGKIDRIDFLSPKEVEVIDYKTGKLTPQKLESFSKEHRQIVFYQLLWNLAPKTDSRMVKGTLFFLEAPAHQQRQSFIVTEEDLERLQGEIRLLQDALKNLDFFNPDTWCHECEFCKMKTGGR